MQDDNDYNREFCYNFQSAYNKYSVHSLDNRHSFFGNYFVSAYSGQTSKQEFDRGTKTKRKKKRNIALFDFFNLLNFPVVFQ